MASSSSSASGTRRLRISATPPPTAVELIISMLRPRRGLASAGEIEELRALAKPLRGRSMEMINSTAVGGGVAEILNRLVPLAEELELAMRWDVMKGAEEFFDVTKSFHNAL